jgi:hypothetical protein
MHRNRQEPRPRRGSREARLVVASRTGCVSGSPGMARNSLSAGSAAAVGMQSPRNLLSRRAASICHGPSSWRRGCDYGATRSSQSKRLCVSTNMVAPPRLRGALGLFHLASWPSCEGQQSHRDADNRNGRGGRCTSGRARSATRHASHLQSGEPLRVISALGNFLFLLP